MKKLLVLLAVSMFAVSASGLYEDFENPGSVKMTLNDGQTVTGGYLTGFDTYPATVGLLDGTYPAAVDAPITIEATYNMLGSTYSWASIMVVVGADSSYETPTGLAVTWHHQAYGGRLQVEELISGSWGGGWWIENGWSPPGYDPALDYKLTIVDYGTSLDLGLEEVGNPANNFLVTEIDISTYTRAGDNLLLGNFYNTDAGIDEVLVLGASLPVGDIAPASLSISEPSGSDTYVITLTEEIPGDAEFRVYLHPSLLDSGGLAQATVAPAKAGDPNTALDILFNSANWDTPVTVTVTAFDDAIGEEPVDLTLSHSLVLVSGGPVDPETDPNWANAGFANDTVSVAVGDDDQRYAITINEIDPCGIEVSEQGATSDVYTVVLEKQPTITVTVDIDTDGQTTTNPTSLTFVSGDWNVPKTVTVTAVDDTAGEDDPHLGYITNSVPIPAFVAGTVTTEDFEDEIDLKVTLDPNHYVVDGYLRGSMRYPISSSRVDGSHPGFTKIEATFNMLGSTYSWAGPQIQIGRDDRTGVYFDCLTIFWAHTAYGGRLDVSAIDESAYAENYYATNGLSPADYDTSTDYVMTVIDYRTSLDVTIAEAADPCNNFTVTGIDISGYVRAGDYVGIGQLYNSNENYRGGGIEDLTVTDGQVLSAEESEWLAAPVEVVAPGDGNASIADNDCRDGRATLEGDIDGDCDVDLADLARMAANWVDCTLPNVPGCI